MKDNNKLPMITIIVPSYNHDKYILECLNEVVKIDLPKNIIIIDDGSTDNTPSIINDFISKNLDQNIEFIEKENSGLVSSLNIGLNKTETEFLYLIASDDIPNPSGIKQAVEYLIENANIDFFIGGGENFFDDGRKTKIYTQKHLDFFSLPFEQRYKSLFLDYPSPLLLQSTVFRTGILKKINGWDTNIIWDDYPMFVKLLSTEKIHFIFNPHVETVYYRHHGVNTYKNIVKQYKMVYQAMDMLAPDDLKDQAIGNALGYYGLKALSQLDLKAFVKVLSLTPVSTYSFAWIKMFQIVFNKLKKKI
jgi:glycosyltransferase involved in cell wall biosynthesis